MTDNSRPILSSIIVLYKPDFLFVKKQVENMLNDVHYIILVDNSPVVNINHFECFSDSTRVFYFHLGGNLGIAAAQNYGVKKSISLDSEFVIFFDQDSTILVNSILKLRDSFLFLESKNLNPGIVAPISTSNEIPNYDFNYEYFDRYHRVKQYQSSGSIMRIETLRKVGLLRDSLFIDLVDNDLCWRLSNINKFTYVDSDISLPHTSGESVFRFLKFKFKVPANFRWYFLFRNSFFLLFTQKSRKLWLLKHILFLCIKILIICFFNERKKITFTPLKYAYSGVIDGVFSIYKRKIYSKNSPL